VERIMRLKTCRDALSVWVVALLLVVTIASGAPRIKDIGRVGVRGEVKLIGYGLVVGLDGTGDSKGTEFTVQSVVNMLSRMGITVPVRKVRTKNVAAVIASASLPMTARKGSTVDVTVSSLGDAKSLQGGTLLLTPLGVPGGSVHAYAQGPISVGGFKAGGSGGDMVSQNYTLVGRIPAGATVEIEPENVQSTVDCVDISLFNADYTTAARVADAVRNRFSTVEVEPIDPALVRIKLGDGFAEANDVVGFIASVETTRVHPDAAAIVVINEKTGTIVAGENVTIGAVAIAHGNLSMEISSRPIVSQPGPFSQGKSLVVEDTEVSVDVPENRLLALRESANVSDVARALNALGVNPRDTIAIFQALKEAGALRAELKII
jgi:flagellar P-ring protein precursor FlgI